MDISTARERLRTLLTNAPLPDAHLAVGSILAIARGLGLKGWGGHCWRTAAAMNRIVFNREGTLLIGVNVAFADEGELIGHAAVEFRGACWDVDGMPKGTDEIECWGMLNPEDTDYRNRALDLCMAWNDDAAAEAMITRFPSETAYAARVLRSRRLGRAETILRAAVESFLSRPQP